VGLLDVQLDLDPDRSTVGQVQAAVGEAGAGVDPAGAVYLAQRRRIARSLSQAAAG
jgi:hypothetical protein